MSCEEHAENLSLLDFGETLPPADLASLEAHLRECPKCQAKHSFFDKVKEVASSRPSGPTPTFRTSLEDMVASAAAEVAAERAQERAPRSRFLLFLFIGVLAILGTVGLFAL